MRNPKASQPLGIPADPRFPLVKLGKWKESDLRDKTIEFRLSTEEHGQVEGKGTIAVFGVDQEGFCRVDILHHLTYSPGRDGILRKYHLPQDAIDRICPHSEPPAADFLLV